MIHKKLFSSLFNLSHFGSFHFFKCITEKNHAHLLTPPQLFTVDLADFQSQNSPTRISDSDSSTVIFATIRLPNNQLKLPFLWQLLLYSASFTNFFFFFIRTAMEQHQKLIVQMEYRTLWRKYKSNCHKSGKFNKSFGCQGKEQISRSVKLQDSFQDWAVVKNRGSVFTFAKIQLHLCYLIQLHTSRTYTTMVVLGSFSAALIILSPSVIILLFDFAAERFFTGVSQVKVTCFQLKWKQRHRKEVTA